MASVIISGKQAISIDIATRKQHRQLAKLVTQQLVKDIHIDTVLDPTNNLTDIRQLQDFLSEDRLSNKITEDLSKRW